MLRYKHCIQSSSNIYAVYLSTVYTPSVYPPYVSCAILSKLYHSTPFLYLVYSATRHSPYQRNQRQRIQLTRCPIFLCKLRTVSVANKIILRNYENTTLETLMAETEYFSIHEFRRYPEPCTTKYLYTE